jgi:uncharacterized membrane protein (DUF2068 family)
MQNAVQDREETGPGWRARWRQTEHSRGLLLIGLFKLSKAILSAALGVGALHLLHRDVSLFLLRITNALPIDPEGHFVALVMNKASLIGTHQLKEFSAATFSYAVVCLVEGTGLVLERPWAEWFTISLTLLGLPWESYELAHRVTPVHIGMLVVNLMVLAYLAWFLRRKRQRRQQGRA